MPDEAPSSRRPRQFVCRFAAGEEAHALSGVWRVWAGSNKPDLYIAVRSLGGHIKATVHCPRPRADQPTWKRHFGFVSGARGEVAEAVLADGGSRHKASWPGAQLGHSCTLEWRVMLLGTAIRRDPLLVEDDVLLVAPPNTNSCLVFAVMLGPAGRVSGFPKAKDAETFLLSEGKLSDGRHVWITYCYTDAMKIPFREDRNPRQFVSATALRSSKGELRAFAVADNSDGSLVFWDMRVERNVGADEARSNH